MNNFLMFLYGLISKILIFIGLIVLSAGILFSKAILVIGIIVAVIGGALRFDFKRKSGHIIYN